MSVFLSLSITLFFALLLKKYVTVVSRKKYLPYPPGPKSKPFIGNILDLPTEDAANVYTEWGKKYNSELN